MEHSPGFLKLTNAAKTQVKECQITDVKEWQGQGRAFVLLDVREDLEWQAGHLPGAVHIGRGVLERDIERLYPNPDTPLVLYCGGGYRSALAALSLKEMGYRNVQSMDGGYRGWTEQGLPVEQD
ncbi:rhodanese-like domain-containing protein [Aliiglaciecola sp. CAU 1673]|uniref:rhodanese-like domain-containing protein n=1 Tax=Aliiglaciecola sp. CAU 1673 TaxID=3032595 RepID=UPI0023DCA239|nr:rhodanese-like domain-containing protein [Aliiglaciecola sp. CAU 1673]MDF2178909.1 rhodanese-like domain-containing protein [Aliiglaciecola sp. CAU 1673]